MASPSWFYYPYNDFDQSQIVLTGDEANHIVAARRLHPGDQLVLMNGRGLLAHCVLETADKKARQVTLQVSLVAEVSAAHKTCVLACALPKGDRLSSMLDMASQLGMTDFIPLQFSRSVTRWNTKLQARCDRIVLEACKQSKRAWVPHVHPVQNFSDWITASVDKSELRLLADQFGHPIQSYRQQIEHAGVLTLIVGPEGGLTDEEMSLMQQQQLATLRLAEPILRIETAAVAGLATLNQSGHTI